MPPMMPFLHDAFWLALCGGLALLVWKARARFDLRLPALSLRQPFGKAVTVAREPSAWFTASAPRSSGNSAFDEWRDGEIARIEAQREALEARLRAFESFVDKLKRAKDRETFERFMVEHREAPEGAD